MDIKQSSSDIINAKEPAPKHDHAGHRQRMKNKQLTFGTRIFNDHELMEMLLFYSTPRQNTNEIAHALVERFKTPRKAIEADSAQLKQIKGVKDNTAILFSLISEIYRRDKAKLPAESEKYDKLSTVGEFFVKYFSGAADERFCVMMLDSSMRLIKLAEFGSGSANSATVDPRAVARMALTENATNVIISHNHPSGNAIPSSADRELTLRIETALSAIGIMLIEHIIVGEVGYTPTMQIRLGSVRSHFAYSNLADGFFKKFYNN